MRSCPRRAGSGRETGNGKFIGMALAVSGAGIGVMITMINLNGSAGW